MSAVDVLLRLLLLVTTSVPESLDFLHYRTDEQLQHASIEVESDWTVDEVARVICAYSHDRGDVGECGRWCMQDRSELAAFFPDRSDYIMSEDECRYAAESFLRWSTVFPDISLEDGLAVALREARFQPYAFGRASECGMFQFMTHYADVGDLLAEAGCSGTGYHNGCETEDRVRICQWLHSDVDNQVYMFYHKAADDAEEDDSHWPCHYNSGSECTAEGMEYQRGHLNLLRRIRVSLERAREILAEEAELPSEEG